MVSFEFYLELPSYQNVINKQHKIRESSHKLEWVISAKNGSIAHVTHD